MAALRPFAAMWAFSLIYHQAAYAQLSSSWHDKLLVGLALALVVVPGSAWVLWAACATHAFVVLTHLPHVSNHWLFGGVVSFGIAVGTAPRLMASMRSLVAEKGTLGHEHNSEIFQRVVPACQLSLLVVYASSGFHKLNADFFAVKTSCTSVLTRKLLFFVDPQTIPLIVDQALIVLTPAIELGLPLLLVLPRWRMQGVVLALGFHAVMAMAGYPRFSATCGALFTLFLPAAAWDRFTPLFSGRYGLPSRILVACGLWGLAISASTPRGSPLIFVQLVLTGLVAFAVKDQWSSASHRRAAPFSFRGSRLAMIAPLVLVCVTAAPYLGLSTHRAMSMYSNLRTEAPQSNHLLVGSSWQPFGYQKDLVAIQSSNAGGLFSPVKRGHVMPYAELRARLTDAMRNDEVSSVSVSYERNGVKRYVNDVASDTLLHLPVPTWHRLFFRFRSVEREGGRACTL